MLRPVWPGCSSLGFGAGLQKQAYVCMRRPSISICRCAKISGQADKLNAMMERCVRSSQSLKRSKREENPAAAMDNQETQPWACAGKEKDVEELLNELIEQNKDELGDDDEGAQAGTNIINKYI